MALTQAYLWSFPDGEVPYLNKDEMAFCQFLTEIEGEYSNPQINLDQKKHIEKHLTIVSGACSTNKQISGNVFVKVQFFDKDIKVSVKYHNITGDINPDNDGEYLNVAFTSDIALRATHVKERLQGLKKTFLK